MSESIEIEQKKKFTNAEMLNSAVEQWELYVKSDKHLQKMDDIVISFATRRFKSNIRKLILAMNKKNMSKIEVDYFLEHDLKGSTESLVEFTINLNSVWGMFFRANNETFDSLNQKGIDKIQEIFCRTMVVIQEMTALFVKDGILKGNEISPAKIMQFSALTIQEDIDEITKDESCIK